jgi:hypothetical protein
MVWFSVCLEASRRTPEEAAWDEPSGTWRVSAASAEAFAEAIARRPPSEFRRSLGRAEFGPGVSGTVGIEVLEAGAAVQAKAEAEEFLRHGGFAWRFVSI